MKDNIKFQAIKDFYSLLDEEFVIKYMFSFNKEMNEILDIGENKTISEKVKLLDEIVDKIFNNMKISESEKKQLGEVFTPFSLVHEMVQTLPEEVWSNPNLKILDPSVGMGQFPVVVVQKLMEGLKKFEPDEEKRYKYIMENMIYVCELNIKNMWIFNNLFDRKCGRGLKLNFHRGSFLEKDFDEKMKEWGIEKFDIILGNPPYNDNQNAKGKRGGGDSLWDKFVKRSLNILIDDGYLVYVHPAAWRKPESEKSKNRGLFELMKSNQIHYLEIHNSKDGLKTFGAGTRYDFYCIEKTPKYQKTKIKDELGNIIEMDLDKWNFLPNYNLDKVERLLGKGCNIIFTRGAYASEKNWTSIEKTNDFKYPLVHSTPKGGIRYYYSSRNDRGHFGIPKIIFGESGINHTLIDLKGEYGMTQGAMGIKIDENIDIEKIDKVLKCDEFKDILNSCQWSNFRIDWRLFTYFKEDWYEEIEILDKPIKLTKSVGANVAQKSYDFKVGKKYKYIGRSKKLESKDVIIVKELKNTFRVKDLKGNIADISKNMLEINN